ncbi:LOW QUALITY PROTEIN: protein RTF1 homolog [Chenopodium quinoa]|uniref:LOW QUALITY PROTEIN: protein RTF1 homolog n=1 Tax=Chenopodium quinoa TaxID=63459 RepID=UPI000B787612|nr:LOW QUALITY PROTEIN: protein RTF1 homolog [Chenopodium quinoa]
MADLENLLLEAAGRTGGSGRSRHSAPSSRRRRENAYSDDGSDSKDEDSDENRGYGGRKSNGPQVPLKKRGKDRDDDQGSQDDEEGGEGSGRGGGGGGGSGDDSDVGSDLYKDEDDRQQLAQLTELERELILSDRATKLDDKKLHERVKSRWKNDSKPQPKRESTPPLASSRGVRTSARSADRAAHKGDKAEALNELRAKRMRQQGNDAARDRSGSRGYSPVKRKAFTSAGLSSSSQSDSESDSQSEDGRSKRGGRLDDSDDEMSKPKSNIPTYEDIKGITIRRSKLAKWFMEPFFEELIIGCFVRVGIGMKSGQSIYRLCIVRNVDASDPDKQYKLENKMTYKYLNCVWGSESSAARWQMARVSDSPPLEEEYNQWKKEVERSSGRMPTRQEVSEKKEEIEKTNSFVYSAETVKHMLQEKKSAATRPLNIAAEKERLRREMEAAQYRNDEAQVQKIKARLEELAAVRLAQDNKNSKAHRLSEMNRKNRVENFKNASEVKPMSANLKSGEAGYDPFSRRWTRSINYYSAGDKNKQVGGAEGSAENKGGEKSGVVATVAALEAAADAGKLVDTMAPVDQGTEYNMLHNFDLPISLNTLQRFGGAQGVLSGFMARKQRLEATMGLQVPENDGRRHALTLSVSDYKRRRGLL